MTFKIYTRKNWVHGSNRIIEPVFNSCESAMTFYNIDSSFPEAIMQTTIREYQEIDKYGFCHKASETPGNSINEEKQNIPDQILYEIPLNAKIYGFKEIGSVINFTYAGGNITKDGTNTFYYAKTVYDAELMSKHLGFITKLVLIPILKLDPAVKDLHSPLDIFG